MVWNRPRIGHQGPVRRSTPIDEIPFLAVARSLGDLWSYNSQLDEFVISPDPDCSVIPIDTSTFRCLIFGTDGLYNMLSPQMAVHIVQQAERHNESAALGDSHNNVWLNPSRCLVDKALERWSTTKMRADNTSVVTLLLDPPGPPRAQVLRNKKKNAYPDSGLQIMTRYENSDQCTSNRNIEPPKTSAAADVAPPDQQQCTKSSEIDLQQVEKEKETNRENYVIKPRESTSYDVREDENKVGNVLETTTKNSEASEGCSTKKDKINEESIQINEISSSSSDFWEVTEYEDKEQGKLVNSTSRMTLRHKRTINTTNDKAKIKPGMKRISSEAPNETIESKRKKCSGENTLLNVNQPVHNLRQRKPKCEETIKNEEPPKKITDENLTLKKKNLIRKVLAPKKLPLPVASSLKVERNNGTTDAVVVSTNENIRSVINKCKLKTNKRE